MFTGPKPEPKDWKYMLTVNLHHLEEHEIHLEGELSVTELDLDVHDPMIHPGKPLRYDLTVEKLPDGILVTGSLRLTLDCECVRCLKPFRHELNLADWTCHLPLAGEDRVAVDNDCVDLTPYRAGGYSPRVSATSVVQAGLSRIGENRPRAKPNPAAFPGARPLRRRGRN